MEGFLPTYMQTRGTPRNRKIPPLWAVSTVVVTAYHT